MHTADFEVNSFGRAQEALHRWNREGTRKPITLPAGVVFEADAKRAVPVLPCFDKAIREARQ